jgi:hypothetical protein
MGFLRGFTLPKPQKKDVLPTASGLDAIKKRMKEHYPLVNYHSYGKSPCLMGISTINCHFQ